MPCFVMFVSAVCVLFLLKLKWPKDKSFKKHFDLCSAWAATEPTWRLAKIKFLKIKALLHFTIKISKLARKISRDSVPKDSASIANRVFKKLRIKRWTIMLLLLLKLYAVQGLFVKWEKELEFEFNSRQLIVYLAGTDQPLNERSSEV